jgi:hypothetical protein
VSAVVDPAALRVVRGGVTPEELAAIVVVINALVASTDARAAEHKAPSEWNAPHRAIRRTLPHGLHAWRRSALPH